MKDGTIATFLVLVAMLWHYDLHLWVYRFNCRYWNHKKQEKEIQNETTKI